MSLNSVSSIATIVSRLGESSFPADMIDFLREVAHFDSAIVLAYPGEGRLQVVHDDLADADRELFNSTYRSGLWSLSPLYLRACSGFSGAWHFREWAPRNFEQTPFYQRYWSQAGIFDQFAYVAHLSNGTPLVISLERSRALSVYSQAELGRLKSIAGLVLSLLAKHWQQGIEIQGKTGKGQERLLQAFDDSPLTPRESSVLRYLVLGLSNKLIAREMGISDQTVKSYCKNINAKLGLNGRSEIYARVVSFILKDELGLPV